MPVGRCLIGEELRSTVAAAHVGSQTLARTPQFFVTVTSTTNNGGWTMGCFPTRMISLSQCSAQEIQVGNTSWVMCMLNVFTPDALE